VAQWFGGNASQIEDRRQQRMEHRLHRHAQAQTRQRDAELRRPKIGVNMGDDMASRLGAAVALFGQRRQLGIADADHGQLRRDKKSVQQHQGQQAQDFQRDQQESGAVHDEIVLVLESARKRTGTRWIRIELCITVSFPRTSPAKCLSPRRCRFPRVPAITQWPCAGRRAASAAGPLPAECLH